MKFIAHRINTIEELQDLPREFGIELDIRDSGKDLIVVHNPFEEGILFEEYLKYYQHGTMIVNVKSERIEHRIIELLDKYAIKDYFFLDSSIPMIYLLSNNGNKNNAIRFSEFEPIELAIAMKDRAQWVWIDCFTQLPINKENYKILKDLGYKLCFVSPELQGQQEKLQEYKRYLNENNIVIDAVCSKKYNYEEWME